MGKRALVILGAGASADLMSRQVGDINKRFCPPLTSELFDGRFSHILDRYPRARSLAAVVLDRLSRDEALEAILRDLAESDEPHIIRQFQEIPLYLRELFGQVSNKYCSEPVNYSRLVNRLLVSDFEEVAFVTLNYDTLLDLALGTIDVAGEILDMAGYIRDNWMLVKLHGSVNWGRPLLPREKSLNDMAQIEQRVREAAERGVSPSAEYLAVELPDVLDLLEDSVEMHAGYGDGHRVWNDFYYPAMTIPVEGKAGFSCPPDHVSALEEFLPTCENVLIVGVSGKDADLLTLLKDHLPRCRTVFLIGHTEGATKEAVSRFFKVPQLAAAGGNFFDEGFSTFVRKQQLEKFARSAQ